jgi:hypothetical protein
MADNEITVPAYPTTASAAREAAIRINDPIAGGARGFVSLLPVVLQELHAVINDSSRLGRERGRRLAERLCLGECLRRRSTVRRDAELGSLARRRGWT